MKTTVLKLVAIVLLSAVNFCSCRKSCEHLEGTKWKLTGIVDTKTGKLTELKSVPEDCEDCYKLVFITDTKAEVLVFRFMSDPDEGRTFCDKTVLDLSLLGEYMITDVGRPDGAAEFVKALYNKNTKYYSVNSDELKFINRINNYYLLFKLQEP